ncbi:MAG: hypothetical protein Crog4KO_24230 [Crocinitomicaceae bacterium]
MNMLTITWSVSIEEQFYMAWVFLMALFPFMRKAKGFLPYLIVIALGSILFRFLHIGDERTLYYHTFAVMSDLALGGLFAYGCFHYNIQERLSNIPKWANVCIYLIGLGMIFGARKIFVGDLIFIEKFVIGFFFVYVICDQTFGKHSFFKSDKIPGFFRMGTISYGIYMYHCIVLYFVQIYFVSMGWTDDAFLMIGYVVTSFVLTIVVSELSYRFVEKPILQLKKHF